jgi:hypothetical protein
MVEDIINEIDGQVQIIFERGEGATAYRDAIWMLKSEYVTMPSETLDALKEDRYNNWLAIINTTSLVEPIIDTTSDEPVEVTPSV